VVLLEDIHWADPESLDLLRIVARGTTRTELLILATYRDEQLTLEHQLFQLLPALVREARAELINLYRLGPGDVEALVHDRYTLPDHDAIRLADYLYRTSEGNPLFLNEQLRAMEEERRLRHSDGGWKLGQVGVNALSTLVQRVIESRLQSLSATDRAALGVAAAIGPRATLADWADTMQAEPAAISAVVQRARGVQVLHEGRDGVSYGFSHALVRQELYQQLALHERHRWHLRYAEMLLERTDPEVDQVANHLLRAGDPRASRWLMDAADKAFAIGARSSASERVESALRVMRSGGAPAGELAFALGRLAWYRQFSDPLSSMELLDEALALDSANGQDDRLRASLLTLRGEQRMYGGDLPGAVADLTRALELFVPAPAGEDVRWIRGEAPTDDPAIPLMIVLGAVGRHEQAIVLAEERLGTALEGAPERWALLSFGLSALATCVAETGRPELAVRLFEHTRALLEGSPDIVTRAATDMWGLMVVYSLYYPDRRAEQAQLAEEAQRFFEIAEAAGDSGNWPPELAQVALLERQGQWELIEQLAQRPGACQVNFITRQYIVPFFGAIARRRGKVDDAWELIYEILPRGPRTEPGTSVAIPALQLQRVAIELLLDAGDLAGAQEWIDANARWLAALVSAPGRTWHEVMRAEMAVAQGDRSTARHQLERGLQLAGNPRQPRPLQRVHQLYAELELESGNLTAAERHLQAARTLADAMEARYEAALAQIGCARLSAARGDVGDALGVLDKAGATLEEIGALPALARLDDLRQQIEGRPPANLTPREYEVLQLLATGMTNAEIAEQLFISPRTVDQHLRQVYAKLAVSSRAAATRYALEHGLV